MKTPNVYEVIEAEVARLKAENARLREAANAVLVDLDHYVCNKGPGPDRRLAELRAALKGGS